MSSAPVHREQALFSGDMKEDGPGKIDTRRAGISGATTTGGRTIARQKT